MYLPNKDYIFAESLKYIHVVGNCTHHQKTLFSHYSPVLAVY